MCTSEPSEIQWKKRWGCVSGTWRPKHFVFLVFMRELWGAAVQGRRMCCERQRQQRKCEEKKIGSSIYYAYTTWRFGNQISWLHAHVQQACRLCTYIHCVSWFWVPPEKNGYRAVTAFLAAPREIPIPSKRFQIIWIFWIWIVQQCQIWMYRTRFPNLELTDVYLRRRMYQTSRI